MSEKIFCDKLAKIRKNNEICGTIWEERIMVFDFTENLFAPAVCSKILLKEKTRVLISYIK